MPEDVEALPSLAAYLHGFAARGSRPALIEQHLYRGATYSYAALLGKALALQARLQARGVGAGDRVLLWGASGAAWAIAFYACLLQGAVVVPIDAAFSVGFVARVREQTGAVLLCTDHHGEAGAPAGLPVEEFAAITALPAIAPAAALPAVERAPEDLLEIVYTSGATAAPKGVMITHGNLLANLRPIYGEIGKYKPYAGMALPLRFLHLIPLSHLFGQVMGLFIPAMLDSAVIYPESQAPAQWARLIKQYRASVMIAVPQQVQLFSQWAAEEMQVSVAATAALGRQHGMAWSFWHWRRLHRRLGWKMWAFVVGGAALPALVEDFWNCMGYAMIQGYGLTETAPAIAVTHPFKIRRGAVGRLLAGVETKLAPDGEILVRGGNVSPGYYRNPEATRQTFADGWLHTGDLGRLDEEGNLHFLGRKKEMIVTADGLNVFPEDVERALNLQAAIADSAVVEEKRGASNQIHAVAVLRAGHAAEELDAAVAAANAALEPHQRVRAASVWPQPSLPRTASTQKLQRVAIGRWVNQGEGAAPAPGAAQAAADWREFAHTRWGIASERLQPQARLDADLGLSSLDRVELLSWLEAHAPGGLEELALATAQTVADVDALAHPGAGLAAPAAGPTTTTTAAPAIAAAPSILTNEATWPLRPAWRGFRSLAFPAVVFPFLKWAVSHVEVRGQERFSALRRPLLLIANHQSMLDVPLILRALPSAWRPWVAPAMGIEPMVDALNPNSSARRRRKAYRRFFLLRAFFNVYLLTEGSIARALRRTGRLADEGYCPLIFPEGRRTPDGQLHPFRPGIGVFVANLRIPVMAIRIGGLYEILPDGATHPKRGPAWVEFGPVFHFSTESPEEITSQLESWFKMVASPPLEVK
ncbi:MAG TPA: AMP-binding protein [Terriglobales bacterium]|nr:AMP-binding protein [Terriglobales bacterium]